MTEKETLSFSELLNIRSALRSAIKSGDYDTPSVEALKEVSAKIERKISEYMNVYEKVIQ
jgi:hypothetical protein